MSFKHCAWHIAKTELLNLVMYTSLYVMAWLHVKEDRMVDEHLYLICNRLKLN